MSTYLPSTEGGVGQVAHNQRPHSLSQVTQVPLDGGGGGGCGPYVVSNNKPITQIPTQAKLWRRKIQLHKRTNC